jgi:hypothetical protein
LGAASQAIWTTKHIHGIPFKDFSLSEKNYHKLWQEIKEFVGENQILFAKGKTVEIYCLKWLAEKAGIIFII